jgi:lipopolysaccharide/colanic/teichoic acid biosynthesis glycosyltransferase
MQEIRVESWTGADWRRRSSAESLAKRSFDVAFSVVGLLLLAPLLVFLGVLVRLSSPGPVLYRGLRTGRFGARFSVLKFRTMVADAEAIGGSTTGKDDARVTPIGALLRRYKLDELPQLFNVLRGDMSFVGPRPEVPEYADGYEGEDRLILTVRPGITDPASLLFIDLAEHVGSEDPDAVFRERILPRKNALRVQYVRQRSFLGDLAILLRTVAVVGVRLLRAVARTPGRAVARAFGRSGR